MGSYCHIEFGGYPLFTAKNWYHEEIVNYIFQPEDYAEEKRLKSSRNTFVWGIDYSKEKGHYLFKGFKQSVEICMKRLEIFGESLNKCELEFNNVLKNSESDLPYRFREFNPTFKKYLYTIKSIFKDKYKPKGSYPKNFKDCLLEDELIILDSISSSLYCILSQLNKNDFVEYDISDIINWWGKIEVKEKIQNEKIIIITEGKTDVEFIENSLKLLYPYLSPYYHFINFEEFKVENNASALVKIIKSFAASNVKHPIIALFDNDTTGCMEMQNLIQLKLPENIKVLKLPDIKFAKKYPTLGPTGKKLMNINGLACGIELYLGKDILVKGEEYTPIRWKYYNENLKRYHGEIENKSIIQKEFREKLKRKTSRGFEEMDLILNTIFDSYR